MNLRTSIVSGAHLLAKAAGQVGKEASKRAEDEFSGMASRVAERVADNPTVIQAIDRIGTAASKPIADAVQPKIIMAAIVAVVVIIGVVHASRRS
jgi:sensor histidine kinase regulating citrate/malate metabolism